MNPRLRIPPLAVAGLAGGLSWIIARSSTPARFDFPAREASAAALGLLGVICSVLGVVSFRRARTTVNPLTPEATTALVASGIYRFTRNPMYLGFLFLLGAEIIWLANPFALPVVPAFILYLNRFQIVPEERALRARFGTEFNAYATQVRRWI
jgi:protein-S-isoprenylcysteine O-methyltransferase Ste14